METPSQWVDPAPDPPKDIKMDQTVRVWVSLGSTVAYFIPTWSLSLSAITLFNSCTYFILILGLVPCALVHVSFIDSNCLSLHIICFITFCSLIISISVSWEELWPAPSWTIQIRWAIYLRRLISVVWCSLQAILSLMCCSVLRVLYSMFSKCSGLLLSPAFCVSMASPSVKSSSPLILLHAELSSVFWRLLIIGTSW